MSRNVNGEGSIRRRKDGRYEGRVFVPTSDRRIERRSIYGKTWEEVHDSITTLKADIRRGLRVSATKHNLGTYMVQWLEETAKPRIRVSTWAGYEQLIRCYIVPLLGRKKLAKLTSPDIRFFLSSLKTACRCCLLGKDAARKRTSGTAQCCALKPARCCHSYLGDGTIRYIHRVLRVALQDAVIDGVLASNPAKDLRLKLKYRPKFTPLTVEEAHKLLAAAQHDRLFALYAVVLAVGLRKGEALALRWKRVDVDQSTLHIVETLQRVKNALQFGNVKTDGSARKIALPDQCVDILQRHRSHQQKEKAAVGDTWPDTDLVFTTPRGTPIDPRNLNRMFSQLCDAAGIRHIRFHDLRHSCATLLYSQGVPLENIQDVLGHSSPAITKTIYVGDTVESQRLAVNKLGFLFEEKALGSNTGVNRDE